MDFIGEAYLIGTFKTDNLFEADGITYEVLSDSTNYQKETDCIYKCSLYMDSFGFPAIRILEKFGSFIGVYSNVVLVYLFTKGNKTYNTQGTYLNLGKDVISQGPFNGDLVMTKLVLTDSGDYQLAVNPLFERR